MISTQRLLPAVLVVAAGAVCPAIATAADDPVVPWFDTTNAAVSSEGWTAAGNKQITASRAWALSWGAADTAVGRFASASGSQGRIAREAAFVTAVHDGLKPTTPSYAAQLDAQRDESLSQLPDGLAKRAGEVVGAYEARKSLREREGDRLDVASVNRPYTPPPPALGVWRPTPPTFGAAVQAGQGDARPFVIPDVARRFVADPPPAIDAPVVIRDLKEIVRLGGKTSERTPEQTQVADFWSQTSVGGFTSILRGAVATQPGSLAERTHDIATFHRVTTDVQIATYKSKYIFLRWRPVTQLNTDDGNPKTPYAPGFTPYIDTPLHPEYPSGHTAYAGAAEQVFRTLVGPRPRTPITATSPKAPGVTRTYDSWDDATRDNINGRVWEGIHLRSTDEYGASYGARVARAVLAADGD